MGHLYWSLTPLPSEDQIPQLRDMLNKAFPEEENSPYLEALGGGQTPLRVTAARFGALALLPSLLRRGGFDPSSLLLRRDANGRPYGVLLGGGALPLDFNLSHSDGHCLCALLTGGGRVGADVEEAVAPSRALPLIRRFCTAGERRLLESLSEEEQASGFTRIWTIREALGKQEGQGMPLRYDATRIPDGIRTVTGQIAETGACLSICFPTDAIEEGCLQDVSPVAIDIRWDGAGFGL